MSKLRSFLQRQGVRHLLRPQTATKISVKSLMMSDHKPPLEALKDLGYAFNSDGELKKIVDGEITNEPFQFDISEFHQECQVHYEEVGMVITDYIYHLLETQEDMLRLPVPKDTTPATGTFVFATKDYDKKDTILILIHGSGAVRAGQWARSLIINENIDMGSQIPYIRKAVAADYGVIVLNTNDNYRISGNKIPKSGSPDEHAKYVWEKYVVKTEASNILIAAHSYGGVVTMNLALKYKSDFKKLVKAIAMTDSVHGFSSKSIPEFVIQNSMNWISSEEPLDTRMPTREHEIQMVSAGHPKHEMTSYTCMESVFKFFEDKLAKN